ncbi:carboxymuconolactone decarboxylase family protein [Sphingobacterium sp. UBA6320]|uniref:carboxymuconolactone decarboxylase family protein n=1 Tax=Sphingobacterium sp. UBA6320 TaxID=1947510 RepID=UPI0025CF9C74|nr:carboxymuconolactone decarboxylase family protein [Sphingobacterium sp. UBA6320]
MKQFKIIGLIAILIAISWFTNPLKAQQMALTTKSLNLQEQSIITISALTATGDLNKLKTALNTGLENGLTVNEIKEVLVHTYAY